MTVGSEAFSLGRWMLWALTPVALVLSGGLFAMVGRVLLDGLRLWIQFSLADG